jgi:16S rRNA (cytidine1402-2'-O)-methyltransferase
VIPKASGEIGELFVVATPIGNLEDITVRALRIFREADIIACEDTRNTGMLLKHYEIAPKKLLSYHSYSSNDRQDYIVELLLSGQNIALVSDAGTPGISDPAYGLVRQAAEAGIRITPVPGASALLSAIVCSGLPTHHFTYLGFLPVKKGRKTLLESLKDKDHTVIIYESVHRIERTLADLQNVFGPDCPVVVGRELTKKFEQFVRGTLGEINSGTIPYEKKGEFVICI